MSGARSLRHRGDLVTLAALNLNVVRGENSLFSGLGFSLSAGEALIVRGANGSGKTSLLRALAGLLAPDAGQVYLDGQPLLPLSARARASILYVGHASGIKDELNAMENLRMALAFEALPISEQECQRALIAVDLQSRRALLARRLSQGQRRRITLAQLRLTAKRIWLLDEPTNALDEAGVAIFVDTVSAHLQRGGIAVMATHLPLVLPRARDVSIAALCAGDA